MKSKLVLLVCGTILSSSVHAATPGRPTGISQDPNDWPTYNSDVTGTRFNHAEKSLTPDNVSNLTEQWRFPRADSGKQIGVIHATPSVVDDCAYFGTATLASFYKLNPSGELAWSYRNPDFPALKPKSLTAPKNGSPSNRIQSQQGGILSSALVGDQGVYFGDTDGYIYGLDRTTGKEKWKINTRAESFPDSHPANSIMSSPTFAEGNVIIGGGAFEHILGAFPKYPCCTGRGFLVALHPATGALQWKYNVGPKPEKLSPPVVIKDPKGTHTFQYGPSTSSVWCTPSFDPASHTLYFGTDTHNSPRQPTPDDPRLYTQHSSAIIAIDSRTGKEKWITQINRDDVWNYALAAYDPNSGRYKDQSIGDTPKIVSVVHNGMQVKVVGFGCKNGGFYILRADNGSILTQTPRYTGPPAYPLTPSPSPRTLALPGTAGGIQTGCATDGTHFYVNGMDAVLMAAEKGGAPTGGRVTAITTDLTREHWRHERPVIASMGKGSHQIRNVGDPVASGIALANGLAFFTTVASGTLVALNSATGERIQEWKLGPVWAGPSISRGRVYVGSGNTLFSTSKSEVHFPKRYTGVLHCFGLK